MARDWVNIKHRYDEAVRKLPEEDMERRWYDRVRTWDLFMKLGPATADLLRSFKNEERAAHMRGLAPELHDIVLEAFPAP